MQLIIAGASGREHVGRHLASAAIRSGHSLHFIDTEEAYRGPFLSRKIQWHFCGRRPVRLRRFSDQVLRASLNGASCLITTGLAPISRQCIQRVRAAGVMTANFLTDDPWNPAHYAHWFLEALPAYDFVFTPRRANIDDLRRSGCNAVEYLPFGYADDVHAPAQQALGDCDVFFAGGADPDRVRWISALTRAGLNVSLYGGYWRSFPQTKRFAKGFVPPEQLSQFVAGARICLCLVRAANRDGHSMRTFELAAMRACMLVERTPEHTELFGSEGQSVLYFSGEAELLHNIRLLLASPGERYRLAESVHLRITAGKNKYSDRLAHMLETINMHPSGCCQAVTA